jgi:hypothetical protein
MPVYGTQRARDGGSGSALGTFAARPVLCPNGLNPVPDRNLKLFRPSTVDLKGRPRRDPGRSRNRRQVRPTVCTWCGCSMSPDETACGNCGEAPAPGRHAEPQPPKPVFVSRRNVSSHLENDSIS